MPNIAALHPQIVHFTVALLIVGVAFRLVSLLGRPRFASPAAATLLLAGTAAAVLAVQSGTEAHGPVERIPGARAAVMAHEEHGIRAKNVFLAVAAVELVGLALRGRVRAARFAHIASALVGLVGSFELYEAGEHGGELVYSYAGGPGLRSGDPRDVGRLLMAGLYNQSQEDRKAGRLAESATLVDLMARRFPDDTTVKFLRAESLLRDAKDYPGALAALGAVGIAPTDARLQARKATLAADVYLAMGRPDSARAVLAPAVAAFPQNARLKAKLDSIR